MSEVQTSGIKNYIQKISETEILPLEEQERLGKKSMNGCEKSKHKLIQNNLRLVLLIANEYSRYGHPLDDLICEGNLGLVEAVEKYQPELGKLSTYAAFKIKQKIRKFIAEHREIRVPVHMIQRQRHVNAASRELEETLGRKPTTKEVAKKLNLSEVRVNSAIHSSFSFSFMDAPIGEFGKVADVLSDPNSENPLKILTEKNKHSIVLSMVNQLEKRSSEIIKMRFGLEDYDQMTLEEVGQKYGITRERVRQIERKAKIELFDLLKDIDSVFVAGGEN